MAALNGTRRQFRCVGCGELRETDRTTGRLPTKCDDCDPEGARRRRVEQARIAYRLELERRVAELEALLDRQRVECHRVQRATGRSVCRCGRDYLTVPLDGPEAECPRPRRVAA